MSNLAHEDEYEDFKKRRFLKISVAFFSIIIATIWIVSLRFSFNNNLVEKESSLSAVKNFITEDVENAVDLKANVLNKDQETAVKVQEKAFLQAMSVDISEKLKKDEEAKVDDSKKMLEELEERLKNEKNCPKYIDCMPSIGGPVDCSIPKGCENITQIAY